MSTRRASAWMCVAMACGVYGCGSDDEGEGSLTIAVQSEESITQGVSAGDDVEDIADGWDATFERYAVVIGDIDLHLATDEDEAQEIDAMFAVDLVDVPESGLPLWQIDGLRASRWDVHYHLGQADGETLRDDSVSEDDLAAMRDAGLTYAIRGTLAAQSGRSCPPPALADVSASAVSAGENEAGDACYENSAIAFAIDVAAAVAFGPCQLDGVQGVSIPSGGSQTLTLTLHGDHLFFNGFPAGTEGGVSRLAQWLADCDLNVDGEVTTQELASIELSALSEIDERFQLTSNDDDQPPLAEGSALDYVIAQLKTQGHINGEGECAIDGAEHDH